MEDLEKVMRGLTEGAQSMHSLASTRAILVGVLIVLALGMTILRSWWRLQR